VEHQQPLNVQSPGWSCVWLLLDVSSRVSQRHSHCGVCDANQPGDHDDIRHGGFQTMNHNLVIAGVGACRPNVQSAESRCQLLAITFASVVDFARPQTALQPGVLYLWCFLNCRVPTEP